MWAKEEGRPATYLWVYVKGWGYKSAVVIDNVHFTPEMDADLMELMSSYFKNVGLKGASLVFETQNATIKDVDGDITGIYVEDSRQFVNSNIIVTASTPKWEIFGMVLNSMTGSSEFVEFMKDPVQERVVSDIMITADGDTQKVVLGIISGKANQIRVKGLVSILPRSKWGKVWAMALKSSEHNAKLFADEKYYLDHEDQLEDLTDIIKSRMDEDGRKVLTLKPAKQKIDLMDAFKDLV